MRIPRARTYSCLALCFVTLALASQLKAATPVVSLTPVRISELMYNPPGGEAYEFLELHNPGSAAVDLSGFSFDGVTHTIAAGTTLVPGGVLVIASGANPAAFTNRYRVVPRGYYTGKLANEGERIALKDKAGQIQTSVEYNNKGFWPALANGGGYSLELLRPDGNPNDAANWRASKTVNGSPGVFTTATERPVVRINEFMADNRSALTNAGATPDWVELYNDSAAAVNLSGWSLSDDGGNLRKFVLPAGLNLNAGALVVIWCDTATNAPGIHTGFTLDAKGASLFLFDTQTNRVDGLGYGSQVADYSLARFTGGWQLAKPTPGAANVIATLGDPSTLAINEWFADSLPGEADWLELFNRSATLPVSLSGLHLGISGAWFQISAPGFVGPNSFVQLFADEQGRPSHLGFKLPASGGVISLASTNGFELDKVTYGAQSEGLTQGRFPDGGATIVSFPSNGSPGAANGADSDNDGLPDYWELQNGLNPKDASDAAKDADGDGFSNLKEYLAGTNPGDPKSVLRLEAVLGAGKITLRFTALEGRSYSLLTRAQAGSGAWLKLADVPITTTNGPVELTDTLATVNNRFYQLVTPATRVAGEDVVASLTPSVAAINVAPATVITVALRSPVEPATVTTNSLRVVDDLGRAVAGLIRFGQDFRAINFVPAIPLAAKTVYQVTLTSGLNGADGKPLGAERTWSFTTAPAPELKENRQIYAADSPAIIEARLTTLPQPGGYTFADINADSDPAATSHPKMDVLFQEGLFGAGRVTANGSVEQRGQSVRLAEQKSYKISLANSSDAWRGFRTINLNKHPYDLTRVRNKLSFDLFTTVPNFTSLRTLFVHLFVDDQDYGLFTHVENPDTDFLGAHGLDANGHLYKAQFFEFLRYPDELRLTSDPAYNASRFASILEPKGDKNHAKLLAMLDDLNNEEIPINRVLEKYFSRENFITWLAVNILLENLDTASRNFYLYSPSGSSTWYLLPWDYDGALGFYRQPSQVDQVFLSRWQEGLPNWWGMMLGRRFLRDPNNLPDLVARVEALAHDQLSNTRANAALATYHDAVQTFVTRLPDLEHLPVVNHDSAASEWSAEFDRLRTGFGSAYTNFVLTVPRPMPVFLGDPEQVDGKTQFFWDESFQLQGSPLSYDLEVSRQPDFRAGSIVFSQTGLKTTSFLLPTALPAGNYFWRVTIRAADNPAVNWQWPFDSYYDAVADRLHFGTRAFTLP